MSSEFCSRSIRLNSDLSSEYRKTNGVYFTPQSARRRVFQKLAELGVAPPSTILEPSFGSGEFLDDLKTVYPDATVYGVEMSKEIYDAYPASDTLVNQDFLEYTAAAPVDLVIGNPPYVVTTAKNAACQKGRGNLFVLFIYKCLTEHMADGSVLAFVLPTSFYNCSYYQPCRQYISKNCTVLHVETIDAKYYETGQKTMILILRKETPRNQNFLLSLGDSVYITPDYAELQECIRGASTLRNLGFSVKTGEVVWNQEKKKLTNEAAGAERIIYTSNIGEDGALTFAPLRGEKKQYIRGFQKETVCGPAIVVSRGYGNNYSFQWALVPAGTRFYGENHVNVITGPPASIDRVVASFRSERTRVFIQMFVGNGALSKTELETIFPIF